MSEEEKPPEPIPLDRRWIEQGKTVDEEGIYRLSSIERRPSMEEIEDDRSAGWGITLADRVAAFAGSLTFLALNTLTFAAWVVVNTLFPETAHFDPFPFQFLTMSVSLEAIFLTIFVLMSQNRQADKDRQVFAIDYETNRQTEQENRLLLQRMEALEEQVKETKHRVYRNTEHLVALHNFDQHFAGIFEVVDKLHDRLETLERLVQKLGGDQ